MNLFGLEDAEVLANGEAQAGPWDSRVSGNRGKEAWDPGSTSRTREDAPRVTTQEGAPFACCGGSRGLRLLAGLECPLLGVAGLARIGWAWLNLARFGVVDADRLR